MFKRPLEEAEAVAPALKATKLENDDSSPNITPASMSAQQIKEMMVNAQRMIEQRKKALAGIGGAGGAGLPPPGIIHPTPVVAQAPAMTVIFPPVIPKSSTPDLSFDGDKKRKLAELQAKASKLAAGVLGKHLDMVDGNFGRKPAPLLLDNEGRAIDVSGKQILFPQHQPTLKANIRAQRKDFKGAASGAQEAAVVEQEEIRGNKYFDERLAPATTKSRARKTLKFNEPGKYVALGHRQRSQALLARLQAEIADKARKTGISTAARLAKLSGAVTNSTNGEKAAEYIPQVRH